VILYHFTSRSHHWPLIATTRYLDLSESNINPKAPHSGPDVVWLTVRKDPFGNGLGDGSDIRIGKQTFKGTDKTRVRITVDIHDAQQWPRWSKNHGIKSSWYKALAGASKGDPRWWYVVERPIYYDEWIIAEDIKTGEILWTPDEGILICENLENMNILQRDANSGAQYLISTSPTGDCLHTYYNADSNQPERPCRPLYTLSNMNEYGQLSQTIKIMNEAPDSHLISLSMMVDLIKSGHAQGWRWIECKIDEERTHNWLESDGWAIDAYIHLAANTNAPLSIMIMEASAYRNLFSSSEIINERDSRMVKQMRESGI